MIRHAEDCAIFRRPTILCHECDCWHRSMAACATNDAEASKESKLLGRMRGFLASWPLFKCKLNIVEEPRYQECQACGNTRFKPGYGCTVCDHLVQEIENERKA